MTPEAFQKCAGFHQRAIQLGVSSEHIPGLMKQALDPEDYDAYTKFLSGAGGAAAGYSASQHMPQLRDLVHSARKPVAEALPQLGPRTLPKSGLMAKLMHYGGLGADKGLGGLAGAMRKAPNKMSVALGLIAATGLLGASSLGRPEEPSRFERIRQRIGV